MRAATRILMGHASKQNFSWLVAAASSEAYAQFPMQYQRLGLDLLSIFKPFRERFGPEEWRNSRRNREKTTCLSRVSMLVSVAKAFHIACFSYSETPRAPSAYRLL